MALIQHKWEGIPHASPSVKRVDGITNTRNLSRNPTFKNNLLGISTGSSNATIEHAQTLWGRQGVVDVNYPPGATSWTARVHLEAFTTTSADAGKWVAFGIDLRRSAWATWFGFRIQRIGSTWPEFQWDESEADWQRHVYATQILSGTSSIVPQIYPSETGDYNTPLQGNGRFGMDNIVVAVADTEEDARARVATYFDGDTHDFYDRAMAKVWTGSSWAELRPKFYA